MKQLVFSDTEYFYKKFQTIVYSVKFMQIITDFKTLTEIPEHARKLLRINPGKFRKTSSRKTGPVLDLQYQVSIDHDRFDRIRIRIKYSPLTESSTMLK